jgi:hypothetical protein
MTEKSWSASRYTGPPLTLGNLLSLWPLTARDTLFLSRRPKPGGLDHHATWRLSPTARFEKVPCLTGTAPLAIRLSLIIDTRLNGVED